MSMMPTRLRLPLAFALFMIFSAASTTQAVARKASALVLDATTGRILYSQAGNARRYPASLTKMMTLYLLFEDLEKGRVKLTSAFHVSAHAAAQAPSKLWLKPGQTISVLQAIRAIVTLSANDAAVVIGENLAGTESAFAARMTQTARWLGMKNTRFRNASGLPNRRQYTTAHDMAVLGAALQARFPAKFQYFVTRKFAFRGHLYRNHNHLLRLVRGVDGIKTGYTRASGFNIVTSLRRAGRKVIVVVMGGRTFRARDARARALINRYFAKARSGRQYYARLLAAIQRADQNGATAIASTETASAARTAPVNYAIQIGALPTKQAARTIIKSAEPYVVKLLEGAEPETRRLKLGSTIYFRAMFNGFSDFESAEEACSRLKKKQFPCYAVLRSAEAVPR